MLYIHDSQRMNPPDFVIPDFSLLFTEIYNHGLEQHGPQRMNPTDYSDFLFNPKINNNRTEKCYSFSEISTLRTGKQFGVDRCCSLGTYPAILKGVIKKKGDATLWLTCICHNLFSLSVLQVSNSKFTYIYKILLGCLGKQIRHQIVRLNH